MQYHNLPYSNFQYYSLPALQFLSIPGTQPLENWNHPKHSTVKIHQLWPELHGYTDGWFCGPTEPAITDQPISDTKI